ncbi:MAG: hypothetical protein ACK4E8_00395 [Lacibacter sp.]
MNATAFESQKNLRALLTTLGIHAALLVLLFLVGFAVPTQAPPPVEEGIEVNLGNSDIGFGDIQPLIPGEPAPETQAVSVPPRQQTASAEQEPEKELSERDDADAPEVKKPVTTKVVNKKPPTETPPVVNSKPSPQTVSNPTPAPPRPKALYGGGTGTGGNNADEYNNSRNQGIAGGSGDQGKPGGSPTSDNYTGSGGSGRGGGPTVTSGNRKIINYYSFTGDLDRATIFANIRVSPEGKGTFVSFAQGSTSRSQAYANAISQYLRNIQFDRSSDESMVVVRFIFNVKGD